MIKKKKNTKLEFVKKKKKKSPDRDHLKYISRRIQRIRFRNSLQPVLWRTDKTF